MPGKETVFAVFDSNDHLVSIYKTEEGASKACDELNEILGTKTDSTFLWSVGLNYYYKDFELKN